MMVRLGHVMVIRYTGSRRTGFLSLQIGVGHDIDLFLVMTVIGSMVMIVRRSVEEVFVGMIGELGVQIVVLCCLYLVPINLISQTFLHFRLFPLEEELGLMVRPAC